LELAKEQGYELSDAELQEVTGGGDFWDVDWDWCSDKGLRSMVSQIACGSMQTQNNLKEAMYEEGNCTCGRVCGSLPGARRLWDECRTVIVVGKRVVGKRIVRCDYANPGHRLPGLGE
jgi:hypothetical protein